MYTSSPAQSLPSSSEHEVDTDVLNDAAENLAKELFEFDMNSPERLKKVNEARLWLKTAKKLFKKRDEKWTQNRGMLALRNALDDEPITRAPTSKEQARANELFVKNVPFADSIKISESAMNNIRSSCTRAAIFESIKTKELEKINKLRVDFINISRNESQTPDSLAQIWDAMISAINDFSNHTKDWMASNEVEAIIKSLVPAMVVHTRLEAQEIREHNYLKKCVKEL